MFSASRMMSFLIRRNSFCWESGKMLPWGAGAVALVQLIPDLIPGFIRIFGGFYDQNTHEIIAHNPDWFEDEDEAWDEWEND